MTTKPKRWTVENDRGGEHPGMREVKGPALRCVGFTVATDVDCERAMQVEADAHLIAAAPEMLSVLHLVEKALRERGTEAWFPIEVRLAVQDAIAGAQP